MRRHRINLFMLDIFRLRVFFRTSSKAGASGSKVGSQDEVVLMADEGPRVEIGSGGRFARHKVDVSRVVGPSLLEAGAEVVASVRFARGANAWLRGPLALLIAN